MCLSVICIISIVSIVLKRKKLSEGDSLICIAHPYCTRFLQIANERARVQNVRDFPQTKLDSEINAPFLLNKRGDPRFLFYKLNGSVIY